MKKYRKRKKEYINFSAYKRFLCVLEAKNSYLALLIFGIQFLDAMPTYPIA
jgi:hypothetical protein